MLLLRSLLFNVAFYLNVLVWIVVCAVGFFLPQRLFVRIPQGWGITSIWLFEAIVGTRFELRGREKIPPGGLLVAAKHQSVWETFALFTLFDNPTYILKRELMWLPFFGWFLWRAGSIPVNRKAGSSALADMNRRARDEVAAGRQILIYPEGTRRPAGAEPAYKYGVAHLYANLGVPCLPVALNSGLFWPRRSFIRRPGTVVMEILDPIPPGLDRDRFFATLKERLEEASDRLYEEGMREIDPAAGSFSTSPTDAPSPAREA